MLALQTIPATTSYAQQANSYYNNTANNCITLDQRFNDTLSSMPQHEIHWLTMMLNGSYEEFIRTNANIKSWRDLQLAQSVYVALLDIHIDTTMQRFLDLHWVATLLSKFKSTKVVPIQVYRDADGKLCAWDGQHTAILLWVICTKIFKLDPATVKIPVNIYPSSKKSEMRECFLDLNSSAGKRPLDLIDHWIQQVFGVRVDNSTNPAWVLVEKKQVLLEKYDLFVTHDKFNNANMPGAISRLQEINKLDLKAVEWLCEYLSIVMLKRRAADEKEVVMMAHFFFRCRQEGVEVTSSYIQNLAAVAMTMWNADFTPEGAFWKRVIQAYTTWHQSNPLNAMTSPKISKEPVHGFPFLLAQLAKNMPKYQLPRNTSNSNFWPDAQDLF